MVNEIENADLSGTIKKLKDLKSSNELQPKEIKYINSIIDRINTDLETRELWDSKDREIEELKLQLRKQSIV